MNRRSIIRLVLLFTIIFVLLTVFDIIKVFPSISTALREVHERLQLDDVMIVSILDLPPQLSSSSSSSFSRTGTTKPDHDSVITTTNNNNNNDTHHPTNKNNAIIINKKKNKKRLNNAVPSQQQRKPKTDDVSSQQQQQQQQQQPQQKKQVQSKNKNDNNNSNNNNYKSINNNPAVMAGQTKIVAFTDHGFRYVAANWYERLQALGYTTHTIVAVDTAMVDFLSNHNNNTIKNNNVTNNNNNNNNTNNNNNNNNNNNSPITTTTYRYDVMLRPPHPPHLNSHPYIKKLRYTVEQIFALRWKYILQQLELGIHVLMTDCDNIFTRYMPLSELESSNYDVYHAYETRYPADVFERQGFCVCGGMSWFRAHSNVIQFVRMMIDECQDMCDDQVVLNRIILYHLNMTWDASPYQNAGYIMTTTSNQTEDRFNNLPQVGISGRSGLTGHRVKIWDRNVAFRGSLRPNPCPPAHQNWVSMPLFDAYMRNQVWMDKLKAFEVWDKNCGGVNNSFGIQYLPPGFHGKYNRRPVKIGRR